MRWIGILNDEGNIIETGTCPDDCDIASAIGREPRRKERYIDGKGETEELARKNAKYCFPTEII